MKAMNRRLRRQSGTTVVESALVIPLVLLAVLGSLDVGRMLWAQHAVTEAARQGARRAAVGATEVPAFVAQTLADQGIDESPSVVVTDNGVNQPVSVEVEILFKCLVLGPLISMAQSMGEDGGDGDSGFSNSFSISSTAEAIREP